MELLLLFLQAYSDAAYYQPLDAKYPYYVWAPSDSRGYSNSSRDFSLFHPIGARLPVPEANVSNATMAVMLAALGAACQLAAGRNVSKREGKVLPK